MPALGRYTDYSIPMTDRNKFLCKLFACSKEASATVNFMQQQLGKEEDVKKHIIEIAKAYMFPDKQTGDKGHFPKGVTFNFVDSTDLTKFKWSKPGDPATPYFPDVSSPGGSPVTGDVDELVALRTNGTDKSRDPEIKVEDIKPGYIVGDPGTGTVSPSNTYKEISDTGKLEVGLELGKSKVAS